jgi:hypothetical protein
MGMTLSMKVASALNMSKSFEIAQHWCGGLFGEFQRKGDVERERFRVPSPMNDQTNANRASAWIGLHHFNCVPLYQVIARISGELEANMDAMRENLEK